MIQSQSQFTLPLRTYLRPAALVISGPFMGAKVTPAPGGKHGGYSQWVFEVTDGEWSGRVVWLGRDEVREIRGDRKDKS